MKPLPAVEPIRLVLVAPQMTCWGLQQLVQSAPGVFEVLAAAPTLEEVRSVLEGASADVLLVDLDDAVGAQELAECAAQARPRCIALTASQDPAVIDKMVLQGVRGVVRKSDPPQLLLRALEKVHEGELWLDRSATGRLFMEMVRRKATQAHDPQAAKIASLTQRERQMIAAIAADTASPGKVIASRLCISEHTLRNHLSSIYSKLELSSRLDLYAFATRHKLDRLA